jgi:transposase-like protein
MAPIQLHHDRGHDRGHFSDQRIGRVGMPFREVSVMDQKREFVVFAAAEGANVRELCRRFGISPTTGYKLLERYRERGLAGLVAQSRRPKTSPRRTPAGVEAKVLALRDRSNNVWGGRKIRRALEDRGEADLPAASTITQILRRHDRPTEAGSAEHRGPWLRFERESPNELWQMDFKGHFGMHGGRCHPLTALDDHSRRNRPQRGRRRSLWTCGQCCASPAGPQENQQQQTALP